MSKATQGSFFEDFRPGQEFRHATPRTIGTGDAALYLALTGGRLAQHGSDPFARSLGLPRAPLDELLVFHVVFGRTVPDISQNAVANLGYAEVRFGDPIFSGDTVEARSTVIGVKENSNGTSGTVWVRSQGLDQDGRLVLDLVRWVMVRKRDAASPAPEPVVPQPRPVVPVGELRVPKALRLRGLDPIAAGLRHRWGDYQEGERIDHLHGTTIEEAEHRMAARLYQNTARVHFNAHQESVGRFGRCLVYGGHVVSVARALSYNGLEGVLRLAAINAGRHVNPVFAGDTIYAWSQVLEKAELPGRRDLGALRLRLVATRDRPCTDFPDKDADGNYPSAVVLDLDYWALLPRRLHGA